jgi:hypothetical protein
MYVYAVRIEGKGDIEMFFEVNIVSCCTPHAFDIGYSILEELAEQTDLDEDDLVVTKIQRITKKGNPVYVVNVPDFGGDNGHGGDDNDDDLEPEGPGPDGEKVKVEVENRKPMKVIGKKHTDFAENYLQDFEKKISKPSPNKGKSDKGDKPKNKKGS